jgi:hypothetical protein
MARIGESEQHIRLTPLCFDWVQGEATCMFAMPSGEAGFEVKAKKGTTRGQLLLSPDGNVGLTLNDAAERPHIRFEVSAEGKTTIDIPGADKQN